MVSLFHYLFFMLISNDNNHQNLYGFSKIIWICCNKYLMKILSKSFWGLLVLSCWFHFNLNKSLFFIEQQISLYLKFNKYFHLEEFFKKYLFTNLKFTKIFLESILRTIVNKNILFTNDKNISITRNYFNDILYKIFPCNFHHNHTYCVFSTEKSLLRHHRKKKLFNQSFWHVSNFLI